MNITLNIANDQELRAYIKEMIKGQVLSIAREDILTLVKDEFEKKLKQMDFTDFQKLFNKAAEGHIKGLISKDDLTGVARTMASKYISETMKDKDWDKLIDAAAKKKLNAMLEQ